MMTVNNYYSWTAIDTMLALPDTRQRQIEFLRTNHLPTFAKTGQAKVSSTYPQFQYHFTVATFHLTLHYWLDMNDQANIFQIDV
jgi:hypothetical protein